MIIIKSDFLEVAAEQLGAQLKSIKSIKSGYEFLWQRDPDIWSSSSPLLFPVVGRAMNDRLKIDDKEYPITQHGFAKISLFELSGYGVDFMEFKLTSSEESKRHFPFEYNLFVRYELVNNSLFITYTVENTDSRSIYFSIGAHPGFNCTLGDTLEFEQSESLDSYVLNSEHYRDKQIPCLNNEKVITISDTTFENDALIFENTKSNKITLKSKDSLYEIRYNYGNATFLGIWSKPGSPYVCIEPWFGADDEAGTDFDLKDKKTAIHLNIGERFEYRTEIEFCG